ncbi:MAG: alpha/beta hydrolase [Bacillus subtilis]|nr:alpha/beta hydrolase [Bacillus subtilis]
MSNPDARRRDTSRRMVRSRDTTSRLAGLLVFPRRRILMVATHLHKLAIASFVKRLQIIVLVVHYRLAPKHAFPTAFFDALDSYQYLLDHAKERGIDVNKIAVGGDSAGGNLACALTHWRRDQGLSMPCGQMLLYPALDRLDQEGSRTKFVDTPMFSSRNFEFVRSHYFRNGVGELGAYAAPLMAEHFNHLPPTYIETAEFDPLTDDGRKYAEVLIAAAIPVAFYPTQGTPHGYDGMPNAKTTQLCWERRLAWLQALFHLD